jgi:hypothetical protein
MKMRNRQVAVALTASLVAACSGVPEGVVGGCEAELTLPASVATDILFVVDNSNSMSQEQGKVVAQLSAFLDSLANAPVENDFQVGVVSTSVTMYANDCRGGASTVEAAEQSGRLQLGKDLDGVVRSESQRKLLRFNDPDLLEQFGLLIGQGTAGLGQEMGLEAMRLALTEPLASTALDAMPGGNAGFLRPNSRLLVVIVTDEDDCSAPDPDSLLLRSTCSITECTADADCGGQGVYCVPLGADPTLSCQVNSCETPEGRSVLAPTTNYVDFLKNLDDGTGTSRRREAFLAVIGPVDAGGEPERCQSSTDEAFGAGQRYRDAVSEMGERGFIGSICSDDYGDTLRRIAELVSAPQVLDLPSSPPDGNLVRVRVERAGSEPLDCRNGDGFVFEPAAGSAPARVIMQDRCRLRGADQVGVQFICAG